MANYAFLIDQRTCIGCHACSVACKSENEVPLGVYRTWVKYVETGTFPATRRHFQVTRCNHCANPPCVRICPVTAMYQRADGIVEFDPEVCIGCKACLQACPYDAIHIDPETHSAAKCHFCSHRTDLGLEPACVIVCPTQSIVAGDLDDPASQISRLVAREPVSVRKPEQGTAPKLFYIDADEVTLTPTAPRLQASHFWSDLATDQSHAIAAHGAAGRHNTVTAANGRRSPSGTPIREPRAQGLGAGGGPITLGGRVAEQMVQTAYNAQHNIPWHWQVPAYLVTKAIGSGAAMALAVAVLLGMFTANSAIVAVALFAALFFIGITTLLLVADLTHPGKFVTILIRPQWKSWLTRGSFILIGFSLVAGIWFLVEAAGALELVSEDVVAPARWPLALITLPLALASAIYTAFLFAQAEGRDLWQSPLLPFHLAIQATVAGSGALLLLGLVAPVPPGVTSLLLWLFGLGLVGDLFVTLVGEFGIPHASEVAALAAHAISHGPYRGWFWGGGIVLGHLVPLVLLGIGLTAGGLGWLAGLAAIAAIAGLYAFEHAFVMAPQEIPNS